MTPCPFRLAAALALATAAQAASCAEATPSVIRDAKGCGVVNPYPKPDESITWSGACKDGLADGPGTLQWSQGEVRGTFYAGNLSAGKPDGRGIENFANGGRFEGTFVDGRRSGQGVFTWPGGMRYEGAFERGDMTGPGILTLMGTRLEATFTRGQLSGPGVLVRRQGGGERRLPVDLGDAPITASAPASGAASTPRLPRIADMTTCRPEYPPMALRAHATGTSTLALFVDKDGHVQRVRVVHASGADFVHGLLDLSALVALSGCPIATGPVDGEAADRWLRIDYRWVID